MANHKSALKRNRQSEKRRDRNRVARSSVRTVIKQVRTALDNGQVKEAQTPLRTAERAIAKASNKGLYHRSNGARKISRLAKSVAKTGTTKK